MHSPIAPSSANVWVKCPGFVALTADLPDEPDIQETLEGEASHWVGHQVLLSYKHGFRLPASGYVNQTAPNGVIISSDMAEGAEVYVRDVIETAEPLGALAHIQPEAPIAAPSIHPQSFGTTDCYLFHAPQQTLFVWDYKFGHLDVPAFENWQLINYVAGLFDQLQVDGIADQQVRVVMRAVQPRCFTVNGPFKEWVVYGSDLRPYFNILRTAAQLAMSGTGSAIAGPQCRYCPARHRCKAAADAAMAGVDYINRPVPYELSNNALSFELATLEAAKKAIEYRLEGVRDDANRRLSEGQVIPGYRLKAGAGKRKLACAPSVVKTAGDIMGVSLLEEQKACTPSEAERRLSRAGHSEEAIAAVINPLISRPSTGMKVSQDDGTEARRIFTKEAH